MADTNLQVKDATGAVVYLKESGAGTNGDPNVGHQIIDSGDVTAALSATDNAVLDAMVAVEGATTGAAITSDINGTLQQYLRGLIKLAIDTTPAPVSIADGDDAALGITTGAAVITDTNGTLQQYLRGLIKLAIDTTPSAVSIADAGDVTLGAKADAKATTTDTTPISIMSVLKEISYMEQNPASRAVTGTFYPSTQPTSDAGPAQTITRTYTTSADMSTAAALTAAPTGGQKIVATDILVSAAVAMEYSIQMETSANVLASVFIPANGTVCITLRGLIKGDAADKKIYGKASVTGNVRITAVYYSEA